MQKLIWKNGNGKEIELTKEPYGITEWDGFSNTELNVQTQQVPFNDGAVFIDALLEQRSLSVTLAINDKNNLEDRYRLRRELIASMNPKLGEGYLIYENDFLKKQIKCLPYIPSFENHNSNTKGTPKAQLTWIACEPYWEDEEETSVYFDISKLPILENNGDIPTRMKIEFFTRNATNPILINMTTGKSIGFNGVLDNNLYIDTNSGQKKVYTENYNFKPSRYYGRLYKLCYNSKLFAYFGITQDANVRRYNIVKSYDGKKWEVVFSTEWSADNDGFEKILYDKTKDLIIAVDSTRIFASQNGEDWVIKYNNFTSAKDIIIADGEYVVLTSAGIFISEDLESWTQKGSINAKSITYNKNTGLYIAISDSMELQKSFDLENWTSQTLTGDSERLDLIGYNDLLNLYVVCSQTELYTSVNGSDWNIVQTFNHPNHDLIMAENKILLANYEGLLYSEDGENWNTTLTGITIFCTCYNPIAKIYYCGAWFETRNYYSDNLKDWDYYLYDHAPFVSIIYDDKKYIAVSRHNMYISENENGFNEGESFGGQNECINFIKEKNLYIVSTSYRGILYSKDLITWSNYIRNATDRLYSAVYDEFLDKILVCGKKVIYESADGVNWGYNTVPYYMTDIAYSKKGKFLIAIPTQYENYVLKSTDGANWERLDAPEGETYNFLSITYCEDLDIFVAVGDSVRYSQDGVNWHSASIKGTTQIMNSVTYSKELKLFIAVGLGGDIIVSPDADKWTLYNCGINVNLTDVTYGKKDNEFMICGDEGTIVYMNWLSAENQIQNIQQDSDIDLKLVIGGNQFRLFMDDGEFTCRISYRQKYNGV